MMKKLIFALLILMPCVAWGATITKYVDASASGTGDGSSWTNAYTSLNTALDTENNGANADLTDNGGDVLVFECRGATVDGTAAVVTGYTTSATCYIDIKGDFVGTKYDSTKFHMTVAGDAITLNNSGVFVRIHNVQIVQAGYGAIECANAVAVGTVYIYSNLLINTVAADNVTGISCDVHGTLYVYSNIIVGFCSNGSTAWGISSCTGGDGNTVYIYGNTIDRAGIGSYGAAIGTRNKYTTVIARNNILIGYDNHWANAQGTFAAGTDYNATDYESIGYTVTGSGNSHDRVSQTFTFVDGANATLTLRDYALQATDVGAKDYGVNLGSPYNVDILGNSPSGAKDIGAHEYITEISVDSQAIAIN